MSHIYVFSPSGAVRDRAAFRRGVRRLEALGHQVEVDPAALDRYQRFAGDDPTRVAAVARAAASGADVALMSRGGYGLTRILPDLPWKAMAKAVERGLRFVGHSDFTALQLGLLARTGASSWAGPGLTDDFGSESEPDEIMAACFDDLLLEQGEGTGWRLSAERGAGAAVADPGLDRLRTRAVHGATLWGGNLSMLVSLLGTPWWPEVRGGVLFLEDVNEHPFRIERMLTQLLHAGVLGRQKALLLGSFTQYRLTPADRGFSMKTVVQRLRSLVDIPVLTGLPFGHVPTKVLLPVGAKVDLALDGRDALLVWGHV